MRGFYSVLSSRLADVTLRMFSILSVLLCFTTRAQEWEWDTGSPGFPETAVEDEGDSSEVLALWHLPQQTQAQLICEQTQTGNTNYSRGDLFIPSP